MQILLKIEIVKSIYKCKKLYQIRLQYIKANAINMCVQMHIRGCRGKYQKCWNQNFSTLNRVKERYFSDQG